MPKFETATQDWEPVVFSKTTATGTATKPKPRHLTEQQLKNIKLDNATEPEKIVQLPRNISAQLLAARVAKKLKQQELANQLNIPLKTIQEIESHRYKNDMALAQRIARKLGCQLKK